MCLKSFGKKTAPDARRTCEANNARLPLPKNKGQNADFRAAFNSLVGIGPVVWLALDDVAKEGTFVNTHTGEKVTYTNFAPNQPDNAGKVEHYGEMWNAQGQWNDRPGSHSHLEVICVKPLTMKNEFVFRGQPDIGDVFVSGVNQNNDELYGQHLMFDKNLRTWWQSEKNTGEFIRVKFHETEVLKSIELFRRFDAKAESGKESRYEIMSRYWVDFYVYHDNTLVSTTKTTDGLGNPFIRGSANDLWNPIRIPYNGLQVDEIVIAFKKKMANIAELNVILVR